MSIRLGQFLCLAKKNPDDFFRRAIYLGVALEPPVSKAGLFAAPLCFEVLAAENAAKSFSSVF
ncbi:MAG: hypothetical protein JXR70_13175 [Spirochaetales bacterium]|nr:hypothetical protein [Spirochaetales bacterium]